MLKNFALAPQRRHSSGQPLELEHVQQLEEIAESGEQEEGSGEDLHHHQHHQLQHFCNAAKARFLLILSSVTEPKPVFFLGVAKAEI